LAAQAHCVLATGFFNVDAVSLKQLCVLIVIERSTREVHIPGVTEYPAGAFVTRWAATWSATSQSAAVPSSS